MQIKINLGYDRKLVFKTHVQISEQNNSIQDHWQYNDAFFL